MINRVINCLSGMLLVGWSFTVGATGEMTFSGLLVEPPPCLVDNGASIDVSFDEVGVDTVDGINHRREVPYTLNCNASSDWRLTLTLSGNQVASFDTATLQTDVGDLGIKVYINGAVFELDTPVTIDINNLPFIEAVPVKRPGAILSEGAFSASATLRAEYQ